MTTNGEIEKKKIQFTLTFLGEISVPKWYSDEEIKSTIAREYYERGFDIEYANDIEWEEV